MKKAAYNIVPATETILKTMGEQIKLARLRRDLSAELVAERAGISRASLWKPCSSYGDICCSSPCTWKYGQRSGSCSER